MSIPGAPAAEPPEKRVQEFLAERYGEGAARLAVSPLSGDASTRRYFRLHDGSASSVLALHPEPFVTDELPFVVIRSLLAGWGIPVPELHDQDGERGLLVLEDLGDLTLQEVLKGGSPVEREDLYREAIEGIVALQREAGRGQPRTGCFQISFDLEKLAWELHYFLKHFVETHRHADLSTEDRAVLAEAFHRLAEEIASWPRVLCHRDYHSRNLMLYGGRLVWIDFQDARMGPATYDLVSLLRDSYVELDEEFVVSRAEEFRQKALPGESREVFQRRFDLMSVQRNLKALGTFGYMAEVRGNRVYLPYIPPTLAHARRVLTRYPELGALSRVLAHHLEELQ